MGKSYPFFAASQNALEGITRLFDFVWPTAAALWNLRWQVAGYNAIRGGTTTPEELQGRFVEGSELHGVNLHRACLEHTWSQQRSDLASIVLMNLFSIYESWADEIITEIGATQIDSRKAFQFPSSIDKKGNSRGAVAELRLLTRTKSAATASELYPVLSVRDRVHLNHLDDMMVVYRYYKECRNSLMHRGGKATPEAATASVGIAALANKTLPFALPVYTPLSSLSPVMLDLFGVVGFSDVVRRIILTIDAELTQTAAADAIMIERWRSQVGMVQLSTDPDKRRIKLSRHLKALGVPTLTSTTALERLLNGAGLIN